MSRVVELEAEADARFDVIQAAQCVVDYNDKGYDTSFAFDANYQLKLMSDLSKALDTLDSSNLRGRAVLSTT